MEDSTTGQPSRPDPSGYDLPRILRYLNNPMGAGVWRAELSFARQAVESTLPSGTRFQVTYPAGFDFLHWVVTNGVGWPAGEDEETRPLRAKAEQLARARPTIRVWSSTTSSWRPRSSSSSFARRAAGGEPAEAPPADTPVPQLVADEFQAEFPNLEVTEAEDWIGLSSSMPVQYLIVVPAPRNRLLVYSISRESCGRFSDVATTYSRQIGATVSSRFEKLYTPEDITFLPYFGLLRLYLDAGPITSNLGANRDLKAALEKMGGSSPEDSVRESGSALEELMSEIFEQCYREKAPARPLGVELRELGSKALEIVGERVGRSAEFDPRPLHEGLGKHIEMSGDPSVKAGLVASQTLATHAKDLNDRLAKVERAVEIARPKSHPLFSDEIGGNIERAIDLRNAATHRGSRRIARFEAAIAARGAINLASWWARIHEVVVDWDAPVQDVVAAILKSGPSIRLNSL